MISASFLPNTYPSFRISTEFLMREVDLMSTTYGSVSRGLVLVAALTAAREKTASDDAFAIPALLPEQWQSPFTGRELARAVGLPNETVRRYVAALLDERKLERTGKATLLVPNAVLKSKSHQALERATYLNIIRLLRELARIDFLAGDFGKLEVYKSNSPMCQALVQAAFEATLQAIGITSELHGGDIMRALIYTVIWTSGVRHLTTAPRAHQPEMVADADRKLVSVTLIANSLRIPYETARRHVSTLLKEGLCVRVKGGGITIPNEVHLRPRSIEVVRKGYQLIEGLIDGLKKAEFPITRISPVSLDSAKISMS
jgi:DNA-binding transcriptional regulator YhcF (GntR family)